jgi:hypothetical protein
MRLIHAMQSTKFVAAWIAHISQIQPQSDNCLESFHRTGVETIEEMQAVLDDYLEGYNTKRPHQGRSINERTPTRAFTEGMPKPVIRR